MKKINEFDPNIPTLLFDYDFIIYKAAPVTENKTIEVINKDSGKSLTMKNRTEFWGKGNKIGGKLADINKKTGKNYSKEDFTILDKVEVEPVGNALSITKKMIKDICKVLGTDQYYGYSGKGDTFRHELCTLQEYKGNRKDLLKPVHFYAVQEYLVKYHNCKLVEGIEADDAVSIDAYKAYNKFKKTGKGKVITVAVDKDAKGTVGFLFNPNKDIEPVEVNGLGALERLNDGSIDGLGRKWFYFQLIAGDTADHYKPSCLSKMNVADVSAYEVLKDCKTDKDCWKAIVNFYQKMYPEPITFTNFRGNELTVDWLYVLQEMVDLAYMKKTLEDRLDVKKTLDKYEIKYEKN